MVRTLDPHCTIKSRDTYLTIIKRHYSQLKLDIKNMLRPVKYFALTSDFWSSIVKDAYMTVTLHWVNNDFQLEHVVLGTPKVPEKHDAGNITARIRELLHEFDLTPDNICGLVTDNAGNMCNSAVELDALT